MLAMFNPMRAIIEAFLFWIVVFIVIAILAIRSNIKDSKRKDNGETPLVPWWAYISGILGSSHGPDN